LHILPDQGPQAGLWELPSLVVDGWMRHPRQLTITHQVFVRLKPGWDFGARWAPVNVGSFVAPFHEFWHRPGMRSSASECLHGALAFPNRQSPERSFSIQQESSAQKAGCAQNLPLTAKCHPQERRKIFQRSNAKTGNRCKHAFAPKENSNEIFLGEKEKQ
jgi:hypothetical protein